MLDSSFQTQIEGLKAALARRALDWPPGPYYEFGATMWTETHLIEPETIDTFSSFGHPGFRFRYVQKHAFELILQTPKSSFKTALVESPVDVCRVFNEKFDDLAVGLSIGSYGRFHWHKPSIRRRFTREWDTELGKSYNYRIRPTRHPTGFKDKKPSYTRLPLEVTSLILALFWTILWRDLKWHSTFINYRKALYLFSLAVTDYSFYEEIFLLLYKCIENIIALDQLQRPKLSNELKELKEGLSKRFIPESWLPEFDRLYRVRCKLAAHGINPRLQFVTYEDVHDIKLFLDQTILAAILPYFLGKPSKDVIPSPLRG